MKNLATYGVISFGVGVAALALTFVTGFGPCGRSTQFAGFLIIVGFITTVVGSLMMIGAMFRAGFGRK